MSGVLAWSWPGFAALSGAWLFLLIPPLVLFYFLKLRRPRMQLPSLALWQQVMQDQRVNSPFQRFKRNLLLLIQLLLLLFLILAAMQPYWDSSASQRSATPVLIDRSASMGALDGPNGSTRLDAAKQEVRKLIDDLLPGQQLALIAVDGSAERLTDFTDNPRLLHAALDRLVPSHRPSDINAGLKLAEAMARSTPVESVLLYSDGNVPPAADFNLPYQLVFQRLPKAGANVGVTDLSARRTSSGWEIYARLGSSSPEPMLCQVRVRTAEATIAEDSSSVSSESPQRLQFVVPTREAMSLTVEVQPDGFDSLPIDNVAYLELPDPRPIVVATDESLTAVRHALATRSDIMVSSTTTTVADLAFTDSPTSATESAVVVRFGVVPGALEQMVGIESELANVTDWNRTAPLLQHVQLLDVQFAEHGVYRQTFGVRDIEAAGFEVLAHAQRGPLALAGRVDNRAEYFWLCHPDRSSLPYRVGFPILIANAIEIARQEAGLGDQRGVSTGVLPLWRGPALGRYRVQSPSGTLTAEANEAGVVAGVPAATVGLYEVTALSAAEPKVNGQSPSDPAPTGVTVEEPPPAETTAGTSGAARGDTQTTRRYGVSLLNPLETSLASVEELQFAEVKVEASRAPVPSEMPLWRYLAWLGLALLLLEWWLYQKRPGPLWG